MRTKHSPDKAWAGEAAIAIWRRLSHADWSGFDPYDGCGGARVPAIVDRSPLGRRVLTQAVKRSPVPLQPLLGVGRAADAYTLGHALMAAARLSRDPRSPDARIEASAVLSALRETAYTNDGAMAWGYHFPVHTRFFSYAPPTPNLIVTAFVAKGLAEMTRVGPVDCRKELCGVATFITSLLPRVSDKTGECFGYLPGEPAAVHNANLLAALVLCEAGELTGQEALIAQALTCARFTAARQAADGSWPYSEEPHSRWVDGFHTGFVLEGLARVVRSTNDEKLTAALERGLRFYVAQLFGPNGEPEYYPQRAYPLDALSAAQGVETLHVAIGGHASRAVPGQLEWIRKHLVKPSGRVAYQVHRGWTDGREFPRWSSAPLMSALAGVATSGEEDS